MWRLKSLNWKRKTKRDDLSNQRKNLNASKYQRYDFIDDEVEDADDDDKDTLFESEETESDCKFVHDDDDDEDDDYGRAFTMLLISRIR